jgi:hypothetical protein
LGINAPTPLNVGLKMTLTSKQLCVRLQAHFTPPKRELAVYGEEVLELLLRSLGVYPSDLAIPIVHHELMDQICNNQTRSRHFGYMVETADKHKSDWGQTGSI